MFTTFAADDGTRAVMYRPSGGRRALLGLGLNWSRPSEKTFTPGLRDQYTLEFFYRIQLSQNFAITPDVQLIIDPALNPAECQIRVFGVRARLAL